MLARRIALQNRKLIQNNPHLRRNISVTGIVQSTVKGGVKAVESVVSLGVKSLDAAGFVSVRLLSAGKIVLRTLGAIAEHQKVSFPSSEAIAQMTKEIKEVPELYHKNGGFQGLKWGDVAKGIVVTGHLLAFFYIGKAVGQLTGMIIVGGEPGAKHIYPEHHDEEHAHEHEHANEHAKEHIKKDEHSGHKEESHASVAAASNGHNSHH